MTDYLYVDSRLGRKRAEELKVLNFDLIISMIGQIPPDEIYTLPSFKTLWIITYDTFFTPISIRKLLVGVEVADPRRWYIRIQIKAFEKYWQKRSLLWKRK